MHDRLSWLELAYRFYLRWVFLYLVFRARWRVYWRCCPECDSLHDHGFCRTCNQISQSAGAVIFPPTNLLDEWYNAYVARLRNDLL